MWLADIYEVRRASSEYTFGELGEFAHYGSQGENERETKRLNGFQSDLKYSSEWSVTNQPQMCLHTP